MPRVNSLQLVISLNIILYTYKYKEMSSEQCELKRRLNIKLPDIVEHNMKGFKDEILVYSRLPSDFYPHEVLKVT